MRQVLKKTIFAHKNNYKLDLALYLYLVVTLCYFHYYLLAHAAGTILIPVSCTDTGLVPGPRVTRRHV